MNIEESKNYDEVVQRSRQFARWYKYFYMLRVLEN